MSTTRFDLVTIDTPDVDRLAAFWASVLDLHEVEREDVDRWIVLASADGVRRLGLQRGAHHLGGTHLDLVCSSGDFEAEVERLVGLGATLVSPLRHEPFGSIANLADPDGNAFDLCAYT
ncbi:MAG: VOC family protein [Ilumatobacteraceae bacterium]|jgi:predicted enzyme related to lactoylglutathione lyase